MAMLAGRVAVGGDQETVKGDWKDAGVIDLSNSPYAKLKTVPVRAVAIEDGFWSQRRKTNLVASIPSMHDELLDHGRMDNFLRLQGRSSEPQKGPVYSDSDIYKWTEAVGFQLQVADDAGAEEDNRCDDSRCCGNPGAERIPEYLLQRR